MINLELKVKGYNCYDQIMSSILAYYDCATEYPIILSKRWWFDFSFDAPNFCLGDRIGSVQNSTDIFYYITGIQEHKIEINPNSDIPMEITSAFEVGNLITAFVDGYFSPWDPHYNRIHGQHAVIIVGIDMEREVLYCSDRYYSNRIESIKFSSLAEWLISYSTYEFVSKPHKISLEEAEQIIFAHIQSMHDKNVFDRMRKFADYFQNYVDLEKEFYSFGNLENTPFVIALNELGYGRESFSRALEYIKVNYRKYELDYFIDEFEQIGRRWRDLGLLICKYISTNNKKFDIGRMVKIIKGFADREESLANELIEYLNGHAMIEIPKFKEFDWNIMSKQMISIDVTNLMNNRAFAQKVENIEKAYFNDSDEFMVLKDKLNQHMLNINNALFSVKIDDFSFPYDNFACDEQTFEVPIDHYNAIYAVVTAQYVNQNSKISVKYTDGTTTTLPFCVTDWRTNRVFGEQIAYEAISCKIVNDTKNSIQGNAYLYLQGIAIDKDKVLQSFTLPYHPNIHIFALAVGK